MRRIYIFLSLLLSLTFTLEASAQQQFINGEPWYCEYYSNRISEDGDNLWLATSRGLIYTTRVQVMYTMQQKRLEQHQSQYLQW
ncbi:MAG: hypothetical protein IKB57_05190 [Bacteroidaceae bacterium]|nr:hypothetical protein [Bacteroidaceae bacterium]